MLRGRKMGPFCSSFFPSFYSGMKSVCEGKSALCGWMCVCDERKENKENALSLIPLQDAPKCTVDRQNVK